jgi:parallel beta-helix repeat protein
MYINGLREEYLMKTKKIYHIGLVLGVIGLFLGSGINSVGAIAHDRASALISFGTVLYVGGGGPGNFSTIQEAVDAANDGDTVYVFDDASPYNEHVMVWKQIQVMGEDKETTVIDGNNTGNVVTIAADFIEISGFTITNGINGIYSDAHSNVTVSGNIVTVNSDVGIHFYGSSDHNVVSGNEVSNNALTGIYFSSFSEYNLISENLIKNNLNGTSLAAYAEGEILGNSFEDNTGYALIFNLWCNNNDIHQNNFIGNSKDVVFFLSSLNRWSFNYWGRPRLFPKPIFGLMGIIPWVNFDWRPLLTPHELQN